MSDDAPRVLHREMCWGTHEDIAPGDSQGHGHVVVAAYLLEHADGLQIVEHRYPSPGTAIDAATGAPLAELKTAAGRCRLNWRNGCINVTPSPLMPRPLALMRSITGRLTTPAGTRYAPWTDGRAAGIECVRKDGYRTFLYLDPGDEDDEGNGVVFVYNGRSGVPSRDLPLYWFDPFTAAAAIDWYTVRTVNGDRDWRADSAAEAREQHEAAHGGMPGEAIITIQPSRALGCVAAGLAALSRGADVRRKVHHDASSPDEAYLPQQVATFAKNLADHYGWPTSELLQSAHALSVAQHLDDDGPTLRLYVVRTDNGERQWHADSAEHAREQHEDAFGGEPGETVLAIYTAPEQPDAPST